MRLRTLALTLLFLGTAATAETVNIDINGAAADATYSGANGVLSGSGTLWNGVLSGSDSGVLLDEDGATTAVTLSWESTSLGDSNSEATNELQNSGAFQGFVLAGLVQGQSYDIALYGSPFTGFFEVTDSTGTSFFGSCVNQPTYVLPGTLGLDYCLLSGLQPADLGADGIGFRFGGADGGYLGLQLSTESVPPVSVPSLPFAALLLLALSLAALARRRLGRR